jgi:purine-binding chemotaxis protein CheW
VYSDADLQALTAPLPPEPPGRPWCVFHCGRHGFAVTLDAVAEVVEVDRLVRLPHAPSRVLGLCVLRREVIPVIDLDTPESDRGVPATPPGCLAVILRTAQGIWAIKVNREGTAVARAIPEAAEGPSPDGRGLVCAGSIQKGDARHAVIDPEAAWRSVRAEVQDWYRDHRGGESDGKASEGIAATGAG